MAQQGLPRKIRMEPGGVGLIDDHVRQRGAPAIDELLIGFFADNDLFDRMPLAQAFEGDLLGPAAEVAGRSIEQGPAVESILAGQPGQAISPAAGFQQFR